MRRKPSRVEMNLEEDTQELEEARKKQQQLQTSATTPTPGTTLLHHLLGNKDSKHQRIGLSNLSRLPSYGIPSSEAPPWSCI